MEQQKQMLVIQQQMLEQQQQMIHCLHQEISKLKPPAPDAAMAGVIVEDLESESEASAMVRDHLRKKKEKGRDDVREFIAECYRQDPGI